jgi:site-specific DNA-methyltransferase (adenine-specific)
MMEITGYKKKHVWGNSTVYLMDCMGALPQYPPGYFDLAAVDPPYGIGISHNMGRRKGDKKSKYKPAVWDNASPPIEFFDNLFTFSKDQIIWGANHFISKMPIDSPCWLMWDKGFGEGLSFAQFELAWTSFNSTCKKYLKGPNEEGDRIHPTQKPVALYAWIYHNYLPQGGKVLDTHLGSGSNRIAAYKAGNIEFTGFEIDEEYFDASVKRFEEYARQLKLF